jgi:hypothetical protein
MSQGPRLRDLIEISADDVAKALEQQAGEEPAAAQLQGIVGFAASLGAQELHKAFDCDVFELLAAGWTKLQSVREGARRSRSAAGQTVITLGQHDLTSTHHPVLNVRVGDTPLPDLKLTLELTARFKSLALAFAEGRLRSAAPGEASVTVRLKYKTVKLKEQATPEWKLPGTISFGNGIEVAN